MFFELLDKNIIDTTSIVQINKINDEQVVEFLNGKIIKVTPEEVGWLLTQYGDLVFVNDSFTFNINYVVMMENKGDKYSVSLQNGFVFEITIQQGMKLKLYLESFNLEERCQWLQSKNIQECFQKQI